MKKLILSLLLCAGILSASAQTDGTLTINVTTTTYTGQYNPKHVAAIWITNSANAFMKTTLARTGGYAGDLTSWSAKSAKNKVDAVTGATITAHGALPQSTWNAKNVAGVLQPDGDYTVNYEQTNGTRKQASSTFTKGATGTTVTTITANQNFTAANLVWVPAVFGITTTSIPDGNPGVAYNYTLALTGGSAPYTWSSANLPAGLSISTAGVLSGTLAVGVYNFDVSVKDATNTTVSKALTLVIANTTKIEAETSLNVTGVAFEASQLNWTGTGYANMAANAGNFIEWTYNAPAAGTYQIDFRYAASSARPGTLSINGGAAIAMPFPMVNASWDVWANSGVQNVTFTAGANTIRITSDNGPNIDYLTIGSLTGISNTTAASKISVYPNPTTHYLVIDNTENLCDNVTVYDAQGRQQLNMILNGESTRVDLSNLSPNIYLVKLMKNGKVLNTQKIVRQ